jgi:cytidine deaminase
MNLRQYDFKFEEYNTIEELAPADAELLAASRKVTGNAYAPYSNFHVGAVAQLANGEKLTGTNQENASYPVGICAERTLLSAIGSLFPNEKVNTIAISYHNLNGSSSTPASPCGMCRQSLVEYEQRVDQPIRLILSGMDGKVFIIPKASMLLPLGFSSDDMK